MNQPEARLDGMAAVVRDLEPQLDELARARIQARLLEAIERDAADQPRLRRAVVFAGAAVIAAAAAALLIFGHERSERLPHAPTQTRALASAPAPARPSAPSPPAAALGLVPYSISGASGQASVSLLGRSLPVLDVPEHSMLRASLGARARLTLQGPAHLELIAATAGRIELLLAQGELALDYDARQGGELVVRAPDARVRVVGTRLAVAVAGGKTRVAVASGVVAVETRSRVLSISAGSEWRSDQDVTTLLGTELRELMRAHGQALLPPPDAHGVLSIEAAQAPVRARLGEQLLGDTPVWALVPEGAVAVSLEDARGNRGVMQADIAASRPASLSATETRSKQASVPVPARPKSPDLYRQAERALGAHDRETARRLLRQLLERFPRSPEAEPAQYELAQLAPSCSEQRGLLGAYLAQYPNGRFVTGARERLARCEAKVPPRSD